MYLRGFWQRSGERGRAAWRESPRAGVKKKKIELKFSLSCRPTTRHGDSGPGHVALHQRPPKIPLRRQALVPVIGLALIFFRIRAACPFLTHRHHDLIRRSRRPSSVLGKIHAPIRTPLRGHKPGRIPHEVIYVPTASAQRPLPPRRPPRTLGQPTTRALSSTRRTGQPVPARLGFALGPFWIAVVRP